GGIATTDSLVVTGTSFSDNLGPAGGGAIDFVIFAGSTANRVHYVSGCAFTNNQGGNGGAIYANDQPNGGTLGIDVSNSTFTDNRAFNTITTTGDNGFGGAIDTFLRLSGTATGVVNISNSTFTGNSASFGGGIESTLRTADSSSGFVTVSGVTS